MIELWKVIKIYLEWKSIIEAIKNRKSLNYEIDR